MRSSLYLPLAAMLMAACGFARAEDPVKKPKADPLGEAFEKLKSLKGEWQVVSAGVEIPKDAKITYRVIGSGTAVIETLFPGTQMEMVSVYHRDGKKLVMTHYCAAGNQPRFVGKIDKKTGDLVLEFNGGTNIDVKSSMHVHRGKFHFVDKDNYESEWMHWVDGKKGGSMQFKMKRIK